ncbi:MAG TPA: sialidase [Candidatus Kapabacteria bacterium]|nr:sialidase [Candidatus Kapabacteria bacterium]
MNTIIRTLCLPVLALLLLSAVPLSAQQTAEGIIARYLQRVGGGERVRAVTTLRRTGTFYGGGGFQAQVCYRNTRTGKVREEFTFGGMTGINAYDGTSGWKTQPWGGKKDPEPLGEAEMKGILDDAAFDDPLFDFAAKKNVVELIGMDQIEGSDVYKLRATLASNGDVRTYYIDADSYVPIKIEVKRVVRGDEREFEIELGDYKQVDGWYLPFAVATGAKGSSTAEKSQIIWDRIEANVPMDDRMFARPLPGAPTDLPEAGATAGQPSGGTSVQQNPAGTGTPAPAQSAIDESRARAAVARVDSETTSGLGARNIGSAAMSGRVAAVAAVHEGDRLTLYVGAASGGVWKSMNGGTTFKPVFDHETSLSIGAIAIDPTNPRVVWVGTGESWTRNSVSVGDGIYKSTDAGESWTNMGLPESERIAKILIDPTDPNTVYVAVPGKLWSDSEERGVYRTTDGGRHWTKVLAGSNPSTGCSMLSMDPTNPKTIYAGMWDFRRRGWTFRSGGEGPDAPSGSGLFKSTDGGTTWKQLDEKNAKGLPPKPWGRVAVTVAPSNANVVYAFIEAVPPLNALYRSSDGGKTWEMKDRSQNMIWRPFYFANLIVDPKNENRIYKPDGSLIMSADGGASFSNISGGTHGDHHDLWVDPVNTDHLIAGDDGGLWYSYDGGNRWWKADNLPISQFYHVSVDMDQPFKVYGGLQDNSSWVGESEYPGGITNSRWENMYGGDGFWMFPDPTNPDYIYAEAQGGNIGRVNRRTHESRDIQPLPGYREGKLRFNWNTPIHISPTHGGTIYLGAQFLFRSTDSGQTWARISPDLSTNDPAKQKQEESGGVTVDNSSAEMHTTIYAIAESPKDPKVIWAGTDDGNLQFTRDDGGHWTNVVGNVRGLPKNAWVSSVEPGHFAAGTIYATFDLHTFGDMHPYAFKSTDYGSTWTPLISGSSPVRGYAHVIKEDLVNPQLLFLGTESGLWISVDGGAQWSRYKGSDMPNVAVRDLAIHPRDNDLVIATHGRGIWIIDDITPLRALTAETLSHGAAFFQSEPVVQYLSANGGWANGDAVFVGSNPPDDAVITYFLQKRHIFGDMKLEIHDPSGKLLATLPTSKRRGLSRVTWSMRMDPPRIPPAATAGFGVGPRYLPGTYTVRLVNGDSEYTAPLRVVPDPRSKHTAADRQEQWALANRLYTMLGDMTTLVEQMNDLRRTLEDRAARANGALAPALRKAAAEVDTLRRQIVATKEGGMITGEERLREHLTGLYGSVIGYEGRPSETQTARADAIARELGDVSKQFTVWVGDHIGPLNTQLKAQGLPAVDVRTP